MFLSPEWAERMLSWQHSGFNVRSRVRARTKAEAERVGKYMVRSVLAQDRLSFLFLISGYREGMPRSPLPTGYAVPALVILPLIGLSPIILLGVNAKTLTTFVVFVLAAVLLSEALLRPGYKHPLLLGGTIAFVLAHLFNSIDSTVPNLPWAASVEAVGALAVLAFSLLGLAFLGYRQEGEA